MRYKYWLMVSLIPLFCLGCNAEDDIVVREGLEMTYKLPQGDHEYDDQIVEWFEKYGFYTLYIYDKKDLFWANETWDERIEFGVGGVYRGEPADPDYVGKQLELLKYSFMDIYPDSLLTRYMPLKVVLCSELLSTYWDIQYNWATGESVSTLLSDKLWANQGWDNMSINGGGQEIETLSARSKMEFQYAVNSLFIKRLYNEYKSKMPEEFAEVSNYSGDYIHEYSGDRIFAAGFLRAGLAGVPAENKKRIEENQKIDFESFMQLIGMPMELLEAYPDRKYDADYTGQHLMSLIGALHPERDSQGLVRKKYNMLINVLKEIGVDIDRLQYPEYE